MIDELKKLEEFQRTYHQPVGESPTLVDESQYKLRYSLGKEELDEYLDACKEGSLVDIADALIDQLYILLGTMVVHGMQDVAKRIFDEVHSSNMSKLGEDGKPIFREDGKILKGPNFFRPDIKSIIETY